METLDDIENPSLWLLFKKEQEQKDSKLEERFRMLHERINKLDLAFRILANDLSVRVMKLEKSNSNPTRRQLNS